VTDRLLTLTQETPFRPRRTDVLNALDEVRSMLGGNAPQKNVTIELDVDDGCHAELDSDRFVEAEANVAGNAVDASPQGGKVTIGWQGVRSGVGHCPAHPRRAWRIHRAHHRRGKRHANQSAFSKSLIGSIAPMVGENARMTWRRLVFEYPPARVSQTRSKTAALLIRASMINEIRTQKGDCSKQNRNLETEGGTRS
jgi:hypothetical protein